jgi:hypothetical protein
MGATGGLDGVRLGSGLGPVSEERTRPPVPVSCDMVCEWYFSGSVELGPEAEIELELELDRGCGRGRGTETRSPSSEMHSFSFSFSFSSGGALPPLAFGTGPIAYRVS